MGLFSDILEVNRERVYDEYIDPCMMVNLGGQNNKRFADLRIKLNEYKESELDNEQKARMRQEFLQRASELEELKSVYLVAEKAVLKIINRGKIQSVYMKDMLDTLQLQLKSGYRAICQLQFEIDQKFKFVKHIQFYSKREDVILLDVLNQLINTTLHHMEVGMFADTGTFRKVVSDCAEVIRCMKNEDYGMSDKIVLSYYLMETIGLKETQHKCCNCGKPLLNNIVYCLNCYERNM